jgi:hypothetical protein
LREDMEAAHAIFAYPALTCAWAVVYRDDVERGRVGRCAPPEGANHPSARWSRVDADNVGSPSGPGTEETCSGTDSTRRTGTISAKRPTR